MAKRWTAKSPVAYTDKKTGEELTQWLPCGTAFTSPDGRSITVLLETLPLNGKIVLQEPLPPRDDRGDDSRDSRGQSNDRGRDDDRRRR